MTRSTLLRHAMALAASALALGLNLALAPLIGTNSLPVFLAAVMVGTWYGGLGPGLVATIVTGLANDYFFLGPGALFEIDLGIAVRQTLYVLSAALIVALGSVLRSAQQRAEARVDELHRADDAIRASEAKFRRLLELAPDAIVIVDREGRIVLANTQAQKLFGYTTEELLGERVEMLLPAGARPAHVDHRTGFFANPHTRPMGVGLDLSGRRKDGSEFPVEISLSPMETDEGLLVMSAIRDITARKHAEARIRSLNDDLEDRLTELGAVNRELEAFSYSVSHDLRAPLRSIDGFSQALLEEYDGALDEKGRDYLRRVRTAAGRMGELIDDLLTLSRVTRREMRREPVDLTALARLITGQLAKAEPGRTVEIRIADSRAALADPQLLRVALENLLGNAWKFTAKQPAPRIEFGATDVDGHTAYFVRDNGVGFDMAYSGKLFGAFQRLHAMHEFPGTGIGLATVQRIITRHGGRVWAEAEIGKGATFYFTL